VRDWHCRWLSEYSGLGFATLNSLEVHIIGGGLAGLSLAIGLRGRGVPVVVSEAGQYPRHRVCGEFISGVSDATLDRLGVSPAFDHALAPRTIAWKYRGRPVFAGVMPEPARAISRHCLDERLVRIFVNAGGELRTGVRIDDARGEGRVRAAGRPKSATATRIGLKAHVRGIGLEKDLEMHAGSNGYAGLVETGDGWINVCGIFRTDRSLRGQGVGLLAAYLESGGSHVLAGMLRDAEVRKGSFSTVAGFEPGRQIARAGELCIGDADRMIPPFTGNGMSMAFQSAEAALDPLVAWSRGSIGWQQTCNIIRKSLDCRFRKRMAAAQWIEPLLAREDAACAISTLASAGALPFATALSVVR